MNPRLSIAIITRNEAHNLRACLASVDFADEVVVVDHGSDDGTPTVAREFGARVIETMEWPGFGAQKNRALDACTGDWILVVDADERVDTTLRDQIEAALAQPAFDVYELPRRSTYCGRFIGHAGWRPDYVRRLLRRGAARFSAARVHESLQTDQPVGRLTAPLIHYSFRSMDEVIAKMNRYSSDSARMLAEGGRRPGLTTAIVHGLAAFAAHLRLQTRFPRWQVRLHARDIERRRLVLPLRQGDACRRDGTRRRRMKGLISVIVTTYNRLDALRAVLAGLAAQTDCDFEVLVADDGSRDDTRALVQSIAQDAPVPVHHVWQEDRGFRAGAARNRAAATAASDYLIFLDGDCVPRPDFIARHRQLAERGWMVAGNRVLLSEDFTVEVLRDGTPIHAWTAVQWRAARRRGDINRTLPLAALPLGPLRKLAARRWQRVRTCNLGLWTADFVAVNGFDETFEGWGFEDSDLAVRLLNHGVRRKEGAFATGVLHLWHGENDRAREGENWRRLQQRIATHEQCATEGLDRYWRSGSAPK